eukprot:scaffold47634_cov34-Phaeocystis_antarctica.AAC.1
MLPARVFRGGSPGGRGWLLVFWHGTQIGKPFTSRLTPRQTWLIVRPDYLPGPRATVAVRV